MSVHLVGGGWPENGGGAAFRAFVEEAAARAREAGVLGGPRIAVVVVRDGDQLEHSAALVAEAAHAGPIDERVIALAEGETAAPGVLADSDGILVGGGLTPAYLQSLAPLFDEIRERVSEGVPYLGFSAGAMIAPERALVGGWRIGGIPVSPEEAGEELDEVTIVNGIGLLDVTVEVHTAQWGTLSRLVAATAAGLTDGGVAIDESTALIVGASGLSVAGSGNVWRVAPAERGVVVDVLASAD
ncbi:Type 1 glutamine amidotransferase-like domain-containing protein [Naasia sp. SYSU D00057]|uniref:Type 1 glutamine amidotransferase-like domain-containing protein n=1 Tax=Naasia sp. SYSU D00057 TaxID=2817380 RepID=UPI001B3113B6|nr:Type 1 glutamine amidotransferase-like domain-containing protein [Naasia sp. SYSU D00057]